MSPREYAKANRHIGEAWEEGREIQYMALASNQWTDHTRDTRPSFGNPAVKWRIKPEPPQPKYRVWEPHEVPVGAVMRPRNERDHRWIISGCSRNSGTLAFGQAGERTLNEFLTRDYEYKWPHEPETAWRPCGVEVKE